MSDSSAASDSTSPTGHQPLSAAARHRLQKVFEHGQRCLEKKDYDYAHQLFTQCVAEDPGNISYVQTMLDNLQRKYDNNKKGARLAGLKIKSHRSAMQKAAGRGEWEKAFQEGCAALGYNPWAISTLVAMAEACRELDIDECQLYYLKWALNVEPKSAEVNRLAALQLTRMGQFDQAIACWHRVEQAQPENEEAQQAISRLSVEKTIHQGGYDSTILKSGGGAAVDGTEPGEGDADMADPPPPLEQRLQEAIAANPAEIDPYLQLADLYFHEGRLDDVEQVLARGNEASGGGDLRFRERMEEVRLRRARQQATLAEKHYADDASEESKAEVAKYRRQANQIELEVYAARSERDPGNLRLKYELGCRLKKAGKPKEAINPLQAARGDSKRLPQVLVELGECFQKIEQYKLALSHYEQAVDACDDTHDEVRKLALYRAGVLATGLRELDLAERRLTELAGVDYSYRDVADRLDKIAQLRNSG